MRVGVDETQGRPLPVWVGYVVTVAAELLVTAALVLLLPMLPLAESPATYLLVTMIAAYLFGVGPAIAAFVLGLLLYVYAFPPYHNIWPVAPRPLDLAGIIDLLVLSAVAAVAALLARRGKHAAEAIYESEARYRSLVETMQEGFCVSDADYAFTYVNPRFAEMIGYSQDEIVGRKLADFLDEPSRDMLATQIPERKAGRYVQYEVTWVARDGLRVYALISPRPVFDDDGVFIGSYAAVTDITMRKQAEERLLRSEQRFRALFERAADALLLHDLDGRFVEANQAACDMLGYSHDELVGMMVWDIVMDYDRDALETLWSELMLQPRTVPATHRRKDGSMISVEGRLSTIEYLGQAMVLAVVRDITERVRAEEERRALELSMEEQKRQFYRETIFSVTGGTLDICDDGEISPYVSTAKVEMRAHNAEQASTARRAAEAFLRECGVSGERLSMFMIGVGEAITNAVKHGVEGTVYAGCREKSVWVAIADRGTGIESLILPRAVLLRGFSTKPSLGLGYCVMLDVADRIHLKTDSHGTVVILEKNIVEEAPEPSLGNIPDAWTQMM